MKTQLIKFLFLILSAGCLLFSVGMSEATAYYRSGCIWVAGHWRNGHWVPGHRVCNRVGVRCAWVPGHWRRGVWIPGHRTCW